MSGFIDSLVGYQGMVKFHIKDQPIGRSEPTFVIAEAGSNHNGEIETAKELIDKAADAGADAVKFQTFRAKDLYIDDRDKVDDSSESTYNLLESLELPFEWIPELHDYCRSQDVYFMSTPFDERSAQEIAEYVPAFKVASFTLSHHPFLENLATYGKPIIMSTGAHEQEEIEEAVQVLRENGIDDLALLHCVSSYPTPIDEINVHAVATLDREFDTVVGFSDHTTDPATAPAAAVALGASIVEKHFTLDKEMEGPDHSFALEPDQLGNMVAQIRKTECALGDGRLAIQDIESGTASRSRRGIFTTQRISKGSTITEESIEVLRPGDAFNRKISAKYYQDILGSEAMVTIDEGAPIGWEDIEE